MVRLKDNTTQTLSNPATGFNPTVVRLKGPILPERALKEDRFNPTVVRLKGPHPPGGPPGGLCFNPTVVRLKAIEAWERGILQDVSIPLWCD